MTSFDQPEARYRELFEYNPLPAWIYRTRDLKFLDVNRAAISHYGWSREEFLTNTVAMVRMPEEADVVEAELRAAAISHERTKPFQHRRKGRSNIWVELCLQNLEFGGQAARLIIANDITVRMEAETLLRQANAQMESLVAQRTTELQTSEAKWRGLVEALPNFISLITAEGVLTYVSGQFATYSGVPTEELLTGGLFQLVHPEDREGIATAQQTALDTGTEYDAEFRLRSKEGAYRWFLSRARPIYERPGGRVTHWLRSIVDIDDQKRRKEQLEEAVSQRTVALKQALDRAECAVRAKSEFLATMSHEIRTPMNGVLGMAHLMLDTPLTTTQKSYLDTIRSSGQALLTIINDILDFSKIEAGKMQLYNEEFDLRSVIEQSMELVAPTAAEKQIRITLDMGDAPLSFVGDSGRFQQILLNLLSNAMKFTAEGSVQLSVCHDPGNLLRFSVRDSGIGLSPEQQANLFEAFTQADRSTTRRFGGTGLGLSIAKRLVQLMGGQIGVVSQLGEGSVFWFNLPLLPVQATEPQAAAPLRLPPRRRKGDTFKNIFAGSQARVLVADDVVTNQMVATGMLREIGLRSDAVSNGVEVIAALESIPYDLILMDVQMPEMDGAEATRRIRGTEANSGVPGHRVPIVALTASVIPGDQAKYMDAGMDDFIAKPVMVGDLVDVLWKWLPKDRVQSLGQELDAVPASSISSLPASSTLNLPDLLSRLMGDELLAIEVLDIFACDTPPDIQSLVGFAQADMVVDVAHLAHKIRGAAATIGGEALQAVALEIETAAGAGNLAAAKARMPDLEKQFGLLMEAIAAHHPVTLS